MGNEALRKNNTDSLETKRCANIKKSVQESLKRFDFFKENLTNNQQNEVSNCNHIFCFEMYNGTICTNCGVGKTLSGIGLKSVLLDSKVHFSTETLDCLYFQERLIDKVSYESF